MTVIKHITIFMLVCAKLLGMNIVETKQGVNGCNFTSFSDNGVLEGDSISHLKSHGQALEQECCFPGVLYNGGDVSPIFFSAVWPCAVALVEFSPNYIKPVSPLTSV